MKARINFSSISEKTLQAKKIESRADKIIKEKVKNASDIFIKEFEDHPISREIDGGENASNISGTLSGRGNLFSFIGFNKGDSPIKNLKVFIERQFNFKKTRKDKKSITYQISYPNLEKIKSQTPMPWEGGRSWVYGVENGISGLSQYLYKKFISASRSSTGIQSKKNAKAFNYKPAKYLTEIINNFKRNLK